MADKKISQLTALSAANLAPSTDVLAIVDTSATETKKIVAQDLVNGVLNVASAVGIGTASPTSGFRLDVVGADFRVSDVASDDGVEIGWSAGGNSGFVQAYDRNASAFRNLVLNNAATIDSSGNLGLGVTPSASWFASAKAMQIGSSGAPYMGLAQQTTTTCDGYMLWGARLSGDRAFQYTTTGDAVCAYRQNAGTHNWFTAGSGTAGNAITFTQAMTLDASGNLGIGTTSPAQKLDVAGGMKGGVIHRKGTYSAGATTPSVSGVSYLDINNSSPTSITNFTGAVEGQMLMLVFRNANTTITRNNTYLAGSVNFTSATNATLTLVYDGTSWYEVCRSTSNG